MVCVSHTCMLHLILFCFDEARIGTKHLHFKGIMFCSCNKTHWGGDKMATNLLTTNSNAFSQMKICKFRYRFHRSLFLYGPINNIPALVQMMTSRRPGDKPLSEPMLFSLLTHICVTRPQWVNWTPVDNMNRTWVPNRVLPCDYRRLDPVLLQWSGTVAIVSANDSAAFNKAVHPLAKFLRLRRRRYTHTYIYI